MGHTGDFENFIKQHENQLVSSLVPKHFWKTLFEKIQNECFDAGNSFSLIKIEYDEEDKGEYDPIYQLKVTAENGLSPKDPNHIYLVDHSWTFRIENARNQLSCMEGLRNRMADLMGINESDPELLSDEIYEEMWKYTHTYSILNADSVEDCMPIWYVMDEVGSAMSYSEAPNFRMVPFIQLPQRIAYSLIFPIKDLEFADTVTCDFREAIYSEKRKAFLLPWQPAKFENNFKHVEVSPDYFLGNRVAESLPALEKLSSKEKLPEYKVYSQYKYVHEYLTDARFKLVENEETADILWYTQHFKDFEELSQTPNKYVNQFPFEYILTVKDLLCITCRRQDYKINGLEITPKWLPVTYNLRTEILQFASYFQQRKQSGLDNYWIIKPFNLARGLDTHITQNINCITQLALASPKIAQKYIERPVLFERECGKVKFDIRYVILLKSVRPLEVYAYKNFFLRFANKPFEMSDFHIYEKHFTVMNYTKDARLKHMRCSEFKAQWGLQYPNYDWGNVEGEIFKMLRDIFTCATLEFPPCGISESPQSRALYAADIMLEWDQMEMQPKILEVNWTPDCQRACEYYPDFYNKIFSLLFLDEENEIFHKL